VEDRAIATRATTPTVLLGREGGGGHLSADVVLPGQEGSGVSVDANALTHRSVARLKHWVLR